VGLFARQCGRCAVSGLPRSLRRFDGVLIGHPFPPVSTGSPLRTTTQRGTLAGSHVRLAWCSKSTATHEDAVVAVQQHDADAGPECL
jgi:hypothetical protein